MEKLIISCCICGAEVTKENNPAVPYTVEEIVREAKSAYDAGAALQCTSCLVKIYRAVGIRKEFIRICGPILIGGMKLPVNACVCNIKRDLRDYPFVRLLIQTVDTIA